MLPRLVRLIAPSLLFLAPAAAAAQASVHPIAVAGVDLQVLDRSYEAPRIAQLGVEWQRPGSRIGARFAATYFRRSNTISPLSPLDEGCVTECVLRRSAEALGLATDWKVDLARGAVRPYLVSGVGLYATRLDTRQNFECTGSPFQGQSCAPLAGAPRRYRFTNTDVAVSAGLGVLVPAGRASVFAELRLHHLGGGQSSVGKDYPQFPLTIGLRF